MLRVHFNQERRDQRDHLVEFDGDMEFSVGTSTFQEHVLAIECALGAYKVIKRYGVNFFSPHHYLLLGSLKGALRQ